MNFIYLASLHKIWFSQKLLHKIFEDNSDYKDFYENLTFKNISKYLKNEKQIEKILKNYDKINLKDLESILEKRKVKIITIKDNSYPRLLKEISNPPFLIYIRWNIDDSPKISVVWSRNISTYWERVIWKIVPDLTRYFTIVSGWAMWCDSFAHSNTLKSNWKTIAIIWTWIDVDYPSSNKSLYDKISDNWWAVISIFPIWEPWNSYNFPIRNEIIAWISVWTIVIEAKEKSWSLITAKLSLDLWRDLFAIPWDIFKLNSLWCNNLILSWEAKLVNKSEDILCEYNVNIEKNTWKSDLIFDDLLEEKIYNILIINSLSIDEIKSKTWESIQNISLKLSMMELKWFISKTSWWKYHIL